LIEERLERVVVVAVDQHDVGVGTLELLGGANPGEASAENDDPPTFGGRHGWIPHVAVADSPGSSTSRPSPERNAFGAQVIGSTARLRRSTSGRGSPAKTCT